jgi:hypothetical protein
VFRNILAAIVVLTLTPYLSAGVIITETIAPTIGKPGYRTYTVTATTNDGSQIQGFDFASLPTYGCFGLMNQVNPAGSSTIFEDSNSFFSFVGADVSQDSQFLFLSSNLTVPSGFASESGTQLRAVFAASSPLGTSVPFAQFAATVGSIEVIGQIQTVVGSRVTNNDVEFLAAFIPEPSLVSLVSLLCGGLSFIIRCRK